MALVRSARRSEISGEKPLRVCYFGTYRANYSRNRIMIEGLRLSGVEVVECHVPLWHGIEDRVHTASGGWLRPAFIARIVRTYWKLLKSHWNVGNYDVMVLGYPGQIDVCMARLLTWWRRKPLALDIFMSIYLIASERGLTKRSPLTANLIFGAERLACALPDLLILDTVDYVRWFQETYGLREERFCLVPTGADDRAFQPMKAIEGKDDGTFKVLYYGTFIPNHGVKYVIEAARILRDDPDIRFEFIGEGPTKAEAVCLVSEYELNHVKFEGWIEKQDLTRRAAEADVCLGAFGTTPQSLMTVQNKVYEGLAMAKPVIVGDSPAIRRLLRHKEHVYVCKRADPESLAEAISLLKTDSDLRGHLAQTGHQLFLECFDLKHNGARYAEHLQDLVHAKDRA